MAGELSQLLSKRYHNVISENPTALPRRNLPGDGHAEPGLGNGGKVNAAPARESPRPRHDFFRPFPSPPSFGSDGAWDHTSCRYLESGLSFYSDKITACGIVHHGTGTPELATYSGGPVPFEMIALQRAELIRKNQLGCDTPCRNCPNLVRKLWPEPTGKIDWIGITHFNGCNNACDYCWLQWADNGRGRPNHPSKSYAVIPAIEKLIDQGMLAADAIVDFGGGGEPTLTPEFDELFGRLVRSGIEVWLHTNGVRLPESIAHDRLDLKKVHVVCSVDAGTAETYRVVKARNHFCKVSENLKTYRTRGAEVIAKYIMQGNNCSVPDIEGFIGLARQINIPLVVWDIDMRFRDPAPEIIAGLARLHLLARTEGLSILPANIGLNAEDRDGLIAKIQSACRALDDPGDRETSDPLPSASSITIALRGAA